MSSVYKVHKVHKVYKVKTNFTTFFIMLIIKNIACFAKINMLFIPDSYMFCEIELGFRFITVLNWSLCKNDNTFAYDHVNRKFRGNTSMYPPTTMSATSSYMNSNLLTS